MDDRGIGRCNACGQTVSPGALTCPSCSGVASPAAGPPGAGLPMASDFPPSMAFEVPEGMPPLPTPFDSPLPAASPHLPSPPDQAPLPVRRPRPVTEEHSSWNAFAQPWQDDSGSTPEVPPVPPSGSHSLVTLDVPSDPPISPEDWLGAPASPAVPTPPAVAVDRVERATAAVRGAAFVSAAEAEHAARSTEPRLYQAQGVSQGSEVLDAPDEPHRPDPVPVPEPPPVPGPAPVPDPVPVPDPSPFPQPPAPQPPFPQPPFPPAPTPQPPFPPAPTPAPPFPQPGPPPVPPFPPPPATSPAYDFQRPVSHVPTQAPPVSSPPAFSPQSAAVSHSAGAQARSHGTVYGGPAAAGHQGDNQASYGVPHAGPGYPTSYPTRGNAPGYPGNSSPQPQPAAEGPLEVSGSLTGHILSRGDDGTPARSGTTKAALILIVVLGLLVAAGLSMMLFGQSLVSGLFGG